MIGAPPLATSRIAPLRHALTGDADARLVWLCNFEVEKEWAQGFIGIPGKGLSNSTALVQRLQEQGFLLAEPGDTVITSHPVDPDFLHYLDAAGLPVAQQLVIADPEGVGIAASILRSPTALKALRALSGGKTFLAPMGVSASIEAVSAATGLPVAGPTAATCVNVNSKIYSRRLAHRLGLREIPGIICETVDELKQAILTCPCGPFPLIVKDAYGVSGKGLFVLRDLAAARALFSIVERRARKIGTDAVHLLVEHFLEKQRDLTYQVTIARSGEINFDFVKDALIHNGMPRGHVIPAGLTSAQHSEVLEAGLKIGAALAKDGYFGVAGMDALIDVQGDVRPVVEINARLNISTYQDRALQRFLQGGGLAVAKQLSVHVGKAPLRFASLLGALGTAGKYPEDGEGLLITCFGSANAARQSGEGRLYVLFFGKDPARIDKWISEMECALARLGAPLIEAH